MNYIKTCKALIILMRWMSHFVDNKYHIPLYACHCLHVWNSCFFTSLHRAEIDPNNFSRYSNPLSIVSCPHINADSYFLTQFHHTHILVQLLAYMLHIWKVSSSNLVFDTDCLARFLMVSHSR
jgi:hypothetical protein